MEQSEDSVIDGQINVLLIEDSPYDARIFQETLKEETESSFRMTHRDRLATGLAYLMDNRVDVILVDLGLPDSQGLDTFHSLYKKNEHIPIIVLTGLDDQELAVLSVKGGAQDYLLKKQLNGDQLLRSIRYAMERKKVEEELKKSREQWQSTFDAMTDAVWLMGIDDKIITCNRAVSFFLKKDSREIIGHTCCEIVHGTTVPLPECPILLMRKTGQRESLELKIGKQWVEISVDPIIDKNGNLTNAVHIIRDITERKQVQEEREMNFARLRRALGATVQAIAAMVETRDPYTAGHQRRVSDLARSIATKMEMTADQVDGIRIASLIHDIGKISVPTEILTKPVKLTEIEFKLIKVHAQVGYDILKDIDFPWPVARMVLEHHERMNGSGYPSGLRGDEILVESRIMIVADVVEAITSHRPYRPGYGMDAALKEITNNKGILYDQEAVEACLKLFQEDGYQLKG